jgi:hypothetical protein
METENTTAQDTMSLQSTTTIATPQAAKYLAQLCKHFDHKCPVTVSGDTGQITFTIGRCELRAGAETLTISATATDPAELEPLKDVVIRHLVRFAFREELAVDWKDNG